MKTESCSDDIAVIKCGPNCYQQENDVLLLGKIEA